MVNMKITWRDITIAMAGFAEQFKFMMQSLSPTRKTMEDYDTSIKREVNRQQKEAEKYFTKNHDCTWASGHKKRDRKTKPTDFEW